jgi:thermitase
MLESIAADADEVRSASMSRRLIVIVSTLLAALIVAPMAQAADQIIVKRQPGLSAAERADVRADADVTLQHTLSIAGIEVVRPDDGDRARALDELRADPDVVWAEPDRLRRAAADPLAGLLWGLHNTGQTVWGSAGTFDADIDAPEAWNVTRGAGATVAVVDTGVDTGHPDLASRLLPGYDWVDDDSDPFDLTGHGTHVAGTVAAAEDGAGVVGVAPEAQVIPLRVLDASGWGSSSDVAAAFASAGDDGVRVVNASLGSTGYSSAERQAISDHPGTLYVVAAGNDNVNVDTAARYPCAYPEANVLCVGATDFNDSRASFSNFGATRVDLFAPGTRTVSTYPLGMASAFSTDGYEILQGTSMATPHVAGAAALVAAAHPDYSAAQIKAAIMASANPLASLAGKAVVAGRLNAAAALGVDVPAAPTATEPATPSPDPVTTTPPPVVTPTPARLDSVRLAGRVVICATRRCRPRSASLSFNASAATKVGVRLRRAVKNSWKAAGSTTVAVPAGPSRLRVASSVAGLRLHPGRYELTLTAPAGPAAVTFAVRAH